MIEVVTNIVLIVNLFKVKKSVKVGELSYDDKTRMQVDLKLVD